MNISLADLDFGTPGNVNFLLGADIFSCSVLHGRRFGPSGRPSAYKTCFEWVFTGVVHGRQQQDQTGTCCFSTTTVDDVLKRFWEIEDYYLQQPVLSLDKWTVVEHFQREHNRDDTGRYIVPLPMKTNITPLGELRSWRLKVSWFLSTCWQRNLNLMNSPSLCRNILRWVMQNLYPHQNWIGPAMRFITSRCTRSERSLVQQVKFVSSLTLPQRAHLERCWTINYSLDPRSTHSSWTSCCSFDVTKLP